MTVPSSHGRNRLLAKERWKMSSISSLNVRCYDRAFCQERGWISLQYYSRCQMKWFIIKAPITTYTKYEVDSLNTYTGDVFVSPEFQAIILETMIANDMSGYFTVSFMGQSTWSSLSVDAAGRSLNHRPCQQKLHDNRQYYMTHWKTELKDHHLSFNAVSIYAAGVKVIGLHRWRCLYTPFHYWFGRIFLVHGLGCSGSAIYKQFRSWGKQMWHFLDLVMQHARRLIIRMQQLVGMQHADRFNGLQM